MKMQTHPITVPNQNRINAFTLVEMLLVVTIIGVLAALVVPRIVGLGEHSRIIKAQADINGGIKTALGHYEIDNGHFPQRLQDLLTQPSTATHWSGPYLDKLPLDPWMHPYIYYYPGKHNPKDYDLLSAGPDGREGTEDDIVNWDQKS
ncbi:MAG TPA: type II secretion system major pseudopilin GspG [Verrucomicrobiae bacterium]|nr:type II secretion system major pseudopilin GspG [Verrucomicrobiae bacterium]